MVSPELLRRYPYFVPVKEESLKKVAMLADEKTVPAGEVMFQEWEPANYLYIIIKGEVHIQYSLPDGARRTVDSLVDGDLLVWSALVEPYRTTGIGIAAKPTRLVMIDAAKLRQLCKEDPQLGHRLMSQVIKLLSDRLDGIRVQLAVT
jgi:CRP/FNR family cyclic AMP-dependent transcriptional regulator